MTKQIENKNLTPYEKAYLEWSARLGQTRTQLRNWQIAGLLSILMAVLLLISLFIVIESEKTYVYVAQVGPDEAVVNKVSLPQSLSPTQAQESYFVGQFINNIMSLPLDPVIARQNWFNAYDMVGGEASSQLTNLAQNSNPFSNLGTQTTAVNVSSISAVSDQSIQATWTTTTYNDQGAVQQQATYNGVFTLAKGPTPLTTAALLKNPFGLKITYFTINNED